MEHKYIYTYRDGKHIHVWIYTRIFQDGNYNVTIPMQWWRYTIPSSANPWPLTSAETRIHGQRNHLNRGTSQAILQVSHTVTKNARLETRMSYNSMGCRENQRYCYTKIAALPERVKRFLPSKHPSRSSYNSTKNARRPPATQTQGKYRYAQMATTFGEVVRDILISHQ